MLTSLPGDATVLLLLFARVGAVLMLLPVFSEDSVPPQVRLLFALALTFGLSGLLWERAAAAGAAAGAGLVGLVVAELLVGLGIGLMVKLLFQAALMAGSLVSLQIGLSTAAIFDPAQGGVAPLLSRVVGLAAALVCLTAGLHHLWIAGIVRSYAVFPVGGWPSAGDAATLAVEVAGRATALGLSLAAPLVVYGIVFNVMLGLAARLTPSLQLFFVAQPLNIVLGLAITAGVLGAMLTAFAAAMADVFGGLV